jgi:hypothetical protein
LVAGSFLVLPPSLHCLLILILHLIVAPNSQADPNAGMQLRGHCLMQKKPHTLPHMLPTKKKFPEVVDIQFFP